MAWKEKSGTRRVEDGSTEFADIVASFIGLTSDTVPTQGQELTDFVAGETLTGSLPVGDYDAEPQVHQVSRVKKLTPNKSQMTVRFRAYFTEA